MKKLRLILMSLAFLGAGAGVFATALNQTDVFVQSHRVSLNTPCDTIVENQQCNGGENICVVKSGPNVNMPVNLFDSQTQACTPLFEP